MAMANDFFGIRYDTAQSAFIYLPAPPHPHAAAGGPKFVLHRQRMQVYDYTALQAEMAAAGYTPGTNEFARDDAWLRRNTDLGAPFEFTFSMRMSSTGGGRTSFDVLGGPATKAQRVTISTTSPQGALLVPYPSGTTGAEATFFDIAVGDTATQVAAKFRAAFRLATRTVAPYFSCYSSTASGTFVTFDRRLITRQAGALLNTLTDATFTGVNLNPWVGNVQPALSQPVLVEGGAGSSIARFRFLHGDVTSADGMATANRNIQQRDISVGGVFAPSYTSTCVAGRPVRTEIDSFVGPYGSRNMVQADTTTAVCTATREFDDMVFRLTNAGGGAAVFDYDPIIITS